MPNQKTLICAGLAVCLILTSAKAQFYYADAQQMPLDVDSLKICIKFDDEIQQQSQTSIIASIGRIVATIDDDHSIDLFQVCSLATSANYGDFLDSVQAIDGIYLVEPYYLLDDSAFLVGEQFCVAFNALLSQAKIDSINDLFNVEIVWQIEGMPNVFTLRNTDSSGYRMLDLANVYYELPETYFSHPIFGVRIQTMGYKLFDYYNSQQFHIKKIIGNFNVASVWDFAGLTKPIVVAVLDDGVTSHEDFPDTNSFILPGRDFANHDFNPQPGIGQAHGMGVVGIIAAAHTTDSLAGLSSNSGIISLAPYVNILPVKIFTDSGNGIRFDSVAAAITYAWKNGAAVLSNSWGFGFICAKGSYDVVNAAIDSAAQFGRNGRGCPVIFAAGNTGGGVFYPACRPLSFAVGAIQLDDLKWYYSNYGSTLDIVAPSGDVCLQGDVWTLDQMSYYGYNPDKTLVPCDPPYVDWFCFDLTGSNDVDYDCNFGGTSAACPVVSGVAALLISKDTNLTRQQIYTILDSSAVTNIGPGGGPITPPDPQYGWGRVDAFRAILSISRGDLNNDNQTATILDLTFMINKIYRGGPSPFPSPLMGDCNCDGSANNVQDLTYLVDAIFRSGPKPVNPCYKF